jgi:hypothetical protein
MLQQCLQDICGAWISIFAPPKVMLMKMFLKSFQGDYLYRLVHGVKYDVVLLLMLCMTTASDFDRRLPQGIAWRSPLVYHSIYVSWPAGRVVNTLDLQS